jgi:hypothetical protein
VSRRRLRWLYQKPAEYHAAVTLLTDLQALAEREDRYHTFTVRTTALRRRTRASPASSNASTGLASDPTVVRYG